MFRIKKRRASPVTCFRASSTFSTLPTEPAILPLPIFKQAVVHPDSREWPAGGRLRLGQLVLVVREAAGRARRRGCRASRRGCLIAIAVHSMCQPGRPLPHGLSHDGSPGLALFQRAKSPGFFFLSLDLDA